MSNLDGYQVDPAIYDALALLRDDFDTALIAAVRRWAARSSVLRMTWTEAHWLLERLGCGWPWPETGMRLWGVPVKLVEEI